MEPAVSPVCPICEAALQFSADTVVGELSTCAECGTEIEVTGLSPIQVQEAPEVEEDWGE